MVIQNRMKENTKNRKLQFDSGGQGRILEEMPSELSLKRWPETRREEMASQLKESWAPVSPEDGYLC